MPWAESTTTGPKQAERWILSNAHERYTTTAIKGQAQQKREKKKVGSPNLSGPSPRVGVGVG